MGFFQNILGGGGPDLGAYKRKKAGIEGQLSDLYNTTYGVTQAADRSGLFDPNQQLALLDRDTAHATQIQSGNAAAAARTLGYRPGDSSPLLQQRAISDSATLEHARLANQIRQNAGQARLSAYNSFGGLGSGMLGQRLGAVDNDIQTAYAEQQQSNGLLGSLLSTAMPYLGGVNLAGVLKKGSGLPRGVTQHSGTPFVW
jgi:hypothetical protein